MVVVRVGADRRVLAVTTAESTGTGGAGRILSVKSHSIEWYSITSVAARHSFHICCI